MVKTLIIFMTSLILLSQTSMQAYDSSVILIQNMANEPLLPKNFRTAHSPFKAEFIDHPSREGLNSLRLSGSAQFSDKSFQTMLKQLATPLDIYVLDLRQESHGFMNGIAVSWYGIKDWSNVGKSHAEITRLEKRLMQSAIDQKNIQIGVIKTKDAEARTLPTVTLNKIILEQGLTEKEFIRKNGMHYTRIPVTDHVRPTDENVDRFITYVKNLPPTAWLHIHCAAGMGRTTTFMALFDMMKNAKKVSFEDIIKRHHYLGGLNFTKKTKSEWKEKLAQERQTFLKEFYQYCQTNNDNFQTPWSLYVLLQKTKTSI